MSLITIIPEKIYRRGDNGPYLGLPSVIDLDLESKRQYLFGRCDIDLPEHKEAAVLFETYIGLDLVGAELTQIYFPSGFIACGFEIQKKLGSYRSWPRHRNHSLVCLMNIPRYPRVIASCWLANNAGDTDFVYTQNWNPDEHIDALYELLQIGGIKDWTGEWGPDLMQLPKKCLGKFDLRALATNFEMLNDAAYSQAAAAVVIGAVFWEHGCEICEKYLFAVLAGCIPVVQGYGIYDRLNLLGFDTFEDLIDTSSQWDKNPITAAWNLLEHNRDFFQQAKDIVADPQIQIRLQQNLDLVHDLKQLSQNAIHNLNDIKAQEIWYEHRLWNNLTWFRQAAIPWDQWFSS